MLITIAYHRRTGTAWSALFSPASLRIVAAVLGAAVTSLAGAAVARQLGAADGWAGLLVAPALYGVLMSAPIWMHASRPLLLRAVAARLPRRPAAGA